MFLGSKFGGDFLVYLGDPVRFHAKYIVICQGKEGRQKMHQGISTLFDFRVT